MRAIRSQLEVAPGIRFVEGPASNWIVLTRPGAAALVDAGYPDDLELVLDSVRAAGGDPATLTDAFVTHAHTDHIGGIPALLERYPAIRVLAAAEEVAAVRSPADREQITVAKAGVGRILRPRFFRWMLAAVRAGGLRETVIPSARAFTADDLARWSLTAVPLPGHTAGSTGYRRGDVLITGDAYVTDHATYAAPRAGAIDPVFSTDPEAAERAAALVAATDVVLPGHGPARQPSS